jgi:hypothetical protein
LLLLNNHLGKAIVSELNMAFGCDEQILRLEFSVDQAIVVENANAYHYFCYDSADDELREGDFFLFKVEIKITHRQILHNDVDMRLILKGFSDAGQKLRMSDLFY